jgi:hypothetical protein
MTAERPQFAECRGCGENEEELRMGAYPERKLLPTLPTL